MGDRRSFEVKVDKLIRSERKSISLQITYDGSLVVRVPFGVSKAVLYNFVNKHKTWIKKKQKEAREKLNFVKKDFKDGEEFLYLGKNYKLTVVSDQKVPIFFDQGFFLSQNYHRFAKEIFVDWYIKEAFNIIPKRVDLFAGKMGYTYNKVKITSARTRWGSCSHKKNLNFSWRLITAPISVIDYVVVHELVHLKEPNHSKRFWDKVKKILPEHQMYRNWLKQNGCLLNMFLV